MTITVTTQSKRQVVDITGQIEGALGGGSGLVNVLVLHTTAAITIADLDPGTDGDYLQAIATMTPQDVWKHPHDPSHFPDHLWSSLIGQSITLPFENGRLVLGTWQRIVLVELDGARARQVSIRPLTQA